MPLGLAVAGGLAAVTALRGLFDTDYFWHLATGRLIVQEGRIPVSDPYSFTWNGEPWIPDQWLAEILIYLLVEAVGAFGALLAFGALAGAAILVLAHALHQQGVGTKPLIATSTLAAAVMLPLVTVRPQILSFLFLAVTLAVLTTASPDARARRLFFLPPLFLIWANAHGMFIVGLGVGFVYLVATVLGRTPMAGRWRLVLGVGLASLLATMVTPSGPQGILYAVSFGDPTDWGARNISEWQSPNFHDPHVLPLLLLIIGVVAIGHHGPGWLRTVALVGVALSLLAVRNIGLAAVMCMPTLSVSIAALANGRGVRRATDAAARRYLEVGMGLFIAVAVLGISLVQTGGVVRPLNERFPVAGTDWLLEHRPDARVLTRYGWGGYVLNELYPVGGRVFADGRMHKYAPQVIDDYATIVSAAPGWERLVDRYDANALLLHVDTPLVQGAAQSEGWCEVLRDDFQVLLLRSCP